VDLIRESFNEGLLDEGLHGINVLNIQNKFE
jgi:hypothetical protein